MASVYIGFGFISLSCFFGLSVFFAALSDLLRLLTVHIYCFHIYALKQVTLFLICTVLNNELSSKELKNCTLLQASHIVSDVNKITLEIISWSKI